MKKGNKKVAIIIASALFISPLLASADEMNSDTSSMNMETKVNTSVMPSPMPNMTGDKQMMMTGIISPEQKFKIGEIMRSLDTDLAYIRGNITKENYEELKKKAEELKISYTEKLNNASDNKEEIKKIIENRFKIFFNNQFIIREQVKDTIVKTQESMAKSKAMSEEAMMKAKESMAKSKAMSEEAMMKAKEMGKEAMEKARDYGKDSLNKAKEMAKNAIDKTKEIKKTENTQIREESKQIKKDLKSQYKDKFISQLKNQLDNIPVEKLQIIISNIEAKIETIAANEKIKATTKEKYLAQLDALLEILKEKLNPTTSDELNIEELLNTSTSTVTQ